MLNDEKEKTILGTCATGTSTPNRIPKSDISSFLSQAGSLNFNDDRHIYSSILEEDDDAELRWYPMRISYSRMQRAVKVEDALRDKGYETFLYLQESLYSMIFVHAMKIQLKLLKRFSPLCGMIKFMIAQPHVEGHPSDIIWISDRMMENFMDAAMRPDPQNQRIPLTYNDFIDKQGKAVRIINGPFAGIEGEIKRVARHRIVVTLLREARIAIGLTHIPPENLEYLDE